MSDTLSFKCPNCGAPLTYSAELGRFSCEYCGSSFTFDEVKNADVNADTPFDWGDYAANVPEEHLDGLVSYVCKSCGAEVVTDAVTAATHCPYCDNVMVIEDNVSGLLKPNGIIPFRVDKKKLKDIVKAYCSGKRLLPNNFLTTHRIEEVRGVYVPFWLYGCRADGNMTFDATRVRTWADSQFYYTETSHYLVTCDGGMAFSRVPADGSRRMDDALMDSVEPYDLSELKDYASGYLSGYLADRFDDDAESCLPRADLRVKNSLADAFRSSLRGFTTAVPVAKNMKLTDTRVEYVLLPVYLITASYNDKKYAFAVNGQTGKMTGNLPVSRAKFWAYFGGIFAVISGLFALANFL